MIRKERNHLVRRGSVSSGLDWNMCQEEIMEDYKKGKMQLSDDSCPSKSGDQRDLDNLSDEMDLENVKKIDFGQNIQWQGEQEDDEEAGQQ